MNCLKTGLRKRTHSPSIPSYFRGLAPKSFTTRPYVNSQSTPALPLLDPSPQLHTGQSNLSRKRTTEPHPIHPFTLSWGINPKVSYSTVPTLECFYRAAIVYGSNMPPCDFKTALIPRPSLPTSGELTPKVSLRDPL